MNDDFGNDFITLVDDDGVEVELEHLDTLEDGGNLYMCFLPADMDEDDEDYGVVIFKVASEDGEEILLTIDDDDELNRIYDIFTERFVTAIDDYDNEVEDEP